ncbi:flagellar biosynthesis protein FlhA [Kineococcus rhizosphaerae]|uniref:Flagellar biosynthesis protein FlhA n=1 Tax=Kineococcus rhizosphaerae TaxID=559628 RepID=A0A2T0RAK7_9ACTN|nr:flagellar biosynthesis protein FlhA [Kineococcus rhizosphaerae]PRY18195.1 flagellar biosynthesis protein FlhA [Kineococcus rhizosphaerae]
MRLPNLSQLVVPAGVVGIVLLLVVPLPAALLDFLIALNITLSLVALLMTMFVKRVLDFSVFPSLILVLTLFRLGLNVASTRLVLSDGYAGKVIEAFGHFVISGSLVIGLVIFLILVVIQFVVITKGAERVAEVGARFTLDAMPGKQMAIDADLNAGLIDEATARQRRADVTAEADFYGAMDGGSKFVKGDAIAGIIIMLINLIGGFAIGMVQHGLGPAESIQKYALLSIGDGLVSQVPALLLSVATGLIVTRSTGAGDMGSEAIKQLSSQKLAFQIAGGALVVLALIPSMPKLPFLVVGGAAIYASTRIAKRDKAAARQAALAELAPAPVNPGEAAENLLEEMRVDPLEVVLAPDLVDLVDTSGGGDLLERVRALRRKIALELGLVVPPVRTRDSLDLPVSTYAVRISGVEVARGMAPPGQVLALGDNLDGLPGRSTVEPVFGLAGKWIPAELRHQAQLTGATVVDRASVLITHLGELVRTHAPRLLSREDVRSLVEALKRTHPAVVDELTPAVLTLGEVQRVLQAMLDEAVPIRDLARIFEALSLRAKAGSDLDGLVEASRRALGPAVAAVHEQDGVLHVITLDPLLEQQLADSLRPGEIGASLALDALTAEHLVTGSSSCLERAEGQGISAVLVCAPPLRAPLRRLLKVAVGRLHVLSYDDVSNHPRIETVGSVSGVHALAS